MKLICPDCGKQYESGKFCLECGAKLQEVAPELVCPSCGFKAKTGKFCPECGTKLTEQVVAPEPQKCEETVERKFNEKDERFAKYYDKKGFPRTIPQEERAIAIEELKPFAEQGISEAQMLLGSIYLNDASKDVIFKGVELLKSAEQSGDKLAYYLIGMGYFLGFDPIVPQDHNEAENRMLEFYAEYQNGDAASCLAELYTYSEEKCDYKKAFEYATIAAEDDEKDGYSVLGFLYLNGKGVEKNIELALENYKMAAALGDEGAMNQIGFIFMGNDVVDANPDQSFYWFSEAAKKGHDVGLYNVGYCYQNGFGVGKDEEKAAEYFKQAADLGYADAMFDLGGYYQNILIDSNKAKMWYQKAAELGHAEAINCLGVIYSDIEEDYEEAVKCYERAVELEVPMAYRNLALCYRDGQGVEQDLKKAEKLFAKAAELGVEDANNMKEDMLSSNDDEQIDLANELLSNGKHKEAIAIYKEFAEKGNTRALGNYGNCLLNGWGTKQNLKDGISWLEKSANQKSAWACIKLAEAYLGTEYNGKTIKFDVEKAKDYLKKSLKYGADPAEINNLIQMTIPSVEISNIRVNRDLKVNGVLGFEVSFKMVANAMVGHKLNISAYCVTPYGNKGCLRKPGTSDGNPSECMYAEICKPTYPSTVWEDCKIFIPYSRIINIQAKWEETLVLMAWDQTNKKSELLACEEIPFSISCITHTFRSNEWDVTLHKQSSKKLVRVPAKKNPILDVDNKDSVIKESRLPMDQIRKDANASYPKKSLKALAIAALKIAEVIEERLPDADVSYMVHPSTFDSCVHPDALPIHFLFKKNGVPAVAVVAVTENGYKTPLVLETAMCCEDNGIEYVRVYATGSYADWIENPHDIEKVEFCKNWLVEKISKHL